ncbi:hypothetical protein Godav_022868 [Gossypium davidsonii]|uniref:Aminotransferase-like plant mobile domain-containing protein n=1 Tax=Gossypium davidsonii TaxID=34287 RepID=A0A7J8SPP4_GOSDV|nr:hypothetical protein [Gossypium davidsonii]
MCGATPPTKAKIGGCLSLLQSWACYVGIPTVLEDIRLLLDQRLKVQVVIPDEFFQNLNIWHVKAPLVNYATMEMHQTDRVLWQFGF